MTKTKIKSKIREILEKYAVKQNVFGGVKRIFDLDSLEKELQQLMTKAVNKSYINAKKAIKNEKQRT